ncbi:MAG: hypothetical protein QME90_11395 [Thermodesulfobacteriota bacterium]|nr:hypothetical protein [Thermodesulfobacteriota bacterium]
MVRREWKRLLWAGVILVLVTGGFGCGDLFSFRTIREREPEAEKPIVTSYRFEDIPLPPGMNLNRKESFVYETRATRTGLLVYEGKGEMERLANFFKEQMPNHQWRLVSNFELHNVMLTFIKEGWSSVIYILPRDDETKRIEIRVGPIEIQILPPSKN